MKIEALPGDAWDPSLSGVLEDMQGRPLNVHGLMAHHPALLRSWWALRNHAVAGGTLGERLAELLILRVAWRLRCWYEWASHVDRGLQCGLSLDDIERVGRGPEDEGWSPREHELLRAVDELMTLQALGPDTLARLDVHFDPRQLMDLMAITGAYQVLGYMLNSWDPPLDRQTRERLPTQVTRAGFEASAGKADS